MTDASAVECAAGYDAPGAEIQEQNAKTAPRLKTIPWVRIIVDTLLVAGILLASSSFLTVR